MQAPTAQWRDLSARLVWLAAPGLAAGLGVAWLVGRAGRVPVMPDARPAAGG